MSRVNTLQALFKRYRRPGDIVFAWLVLLISLYLLSQVFEQTAYKSGAKLFSQPRFWPAVSLLFMTGFAAFHLLGSMASERIDGRWKEVLLWFASLEYAAWFIAYAALVPWAGYLPSTIIFTLLLTLRVGYTSSRMLKVAAACSVLIVVLFKTLLQVKLPPGRVYELLPDGLRQIMMIYF